MTLFEAVLLGIVQGITEFLPISSDGHLELGKAFLNIQDADNLLFTILVHGATVLSIIIIFRQDIIHLFRHLFSFQWNDDTRYIAKLLLSMIPIGIVGVFFEDKIAALFTGNVQLVGGLLIINGFILLLSQLRISQQKDRTVSFLDALLIGIAQCVAVLPGISRSTCTISTALVLGIEKKQAARFSLLMVIIPILGATLLKFKDFLEAPTSTQDNALPYLVGFIAAFATGLLACQWLVTIVQRGKIAYFAIYCFVIGAIAVYLGA
jgi:undecaprenyl-diphosphatase